MASHRLRSAILAGLVLVLAATAACTRSLSTPPPLPGEQGTPGSENSQQATMEAVRSTLLTQTAQAVEASAFQTAIAAETTPIATAIPQGPTALAPVTGQQPTVAVSTPLPTPTPEGFTQYTVEKGDYIYSIARKFRVDPKAIIEANRLSPPYNLKPGQVLMIPPSEVDSASGTEYIVVGGDTVYSIARKFDVKPQAIIDANGLKAPYVLYPGDRLRIP